MRRVLIVVLSLVGTVVPGVAQPQLGDIAIARHNITPFELYDPVTGVVRWFAPLQGAGAGRAILHDARRTDAYWFASTPCPGVCGGGSFGRVLVLGGADSTFVPILTGVDVTQLSSTASGDVILMNRTGGNVLKVDPVTWDVSVAHNGNVAFSANIESGIVDPSTGDFWIGSSGVLYHVTPTAVTAVFSAPGSEISNVAHDPLSGDIFASVVNVAGVDRILRVTQGGGVTDVVLPGSIPSPQALAIDQLGDLIVGDQVGRLWRITNPAGVLSFIAVPSSSNFAAVAGLAVIGGPTFSNTDYTLTGGFTPSPSTFVPPRFVLEVSNVPATAIEGWTAASMTTTLPVGQGGVVFGLVPDPFTFAVLALFPTALPGNLLHWTYPASGFPTTAAVFDQPVFAALSGQTWDFVSVAFDGTSLFGSNVLRVVWP